MTTETKTTADLEAAGWIKGTDAGYPNHAGWVKDSAGGNPNRHYSLTPLKGGLYTLAVIHDRVCESSRVVTLAEALAW